MTAATISLAGKVAIVTGSARENGIGAGIARTLARNGAVVTINYVSPSSASRAENVAKDIRAAGGKALVVGADVSTVEGAKKLAHDTLNGFGVDHIDILVNNAGTGTFHDSLSIPEEEIQRTIAININGPLNLVRATVPHMPSGGRIINISSIASKMGMSGMTVYGATKAALDSLTYSWAQEFGKSKGITVNSVAPGPVATDLVGDEINKLAPRLIDLTRAADRLGTAEDIADAVLLLVSEQARWITGQFVSASGGITGQ